MSARSASRTARAALTAILLGGTALGGLAIGTGYAQGTAEPAPIQPSGPARPLPDFADLAAQVRPAVVSVTVKRTEDGGVRQARGSGFLIDGDGTVVTNNHVVAGGGSVSITLDDGSELPARIVGRDSRTDLAVLQVEAGRKLPSLTLGDSDQVRPGQWVVAVGNPFGLGGSVTAGIVSARGRDIGAGPYDAFLQIDAAINQGNSGGPLFTQDGRVVGVNTAILSPSGGSVGIGFAIPSSLVKDVVGQLRTAGHVTRGYLGIETQPITAAIAPGLGLAADTHGALVAAVAPDSPAAKAGFQPGDVVQSVAGAAVANPHDLARTVAAAKPGEATEVAVLRGGAARTLRVQVAAMPEQQAKTEEGPAGASEQGIGLALSRLSPQVRSRLELPESAQGALVTDVQPGSPAQRAGLRQGDVVTGVGARSVTSPEEAAASIRAAAREGKGLALRVLRDAQARYVAVPGPANG